MCHQRLKSCQRMNRREAIKVALCLPWIKWNKVFQPRTDVDIFKDLASPNLAKRFTAQEAFAAVVTAPILEVLDQNSIITDILAAQPFDYKGQKIPLNIIKEDSWISRIRRVLGFEKSFLNH